MIEQPFSLLQPFADRLDVRVFTKVDAIGSDDMLAAPLRSDAIVSLTQVHGGRSVLLREASLRREEADGVATDTAGLWLTIRSADCQTMLIFAPAQNVIGLLHIGWKGLLAHAIPHLFALLHQEWGIHPHETIVCSAPSLCLSCATFTDPLQELPGIDPRFFLGKQVDLRGIADDALRRLGVPEHQCERLDSCTRCSKETFWSYRAEPEAIAGGMRNVLTCRLR